MTGDRPATVTLPPAGDGSRRSRRRRASSSDGAGPGLVGVGAVLLAALVGLAAWVSTRGDEAPSGPAPTTTVPVVDAAATGLLLQHDATGMLRGVTLLVVAGGGEGGTLIHVPPGTMVEAPALGLVPMSEAAGAGEATARTAFENLLGARLDEVATVGPEEMAAAVRPAGSLEVDIPVPVIRRQEGRAETAFRSGVARIRPEEVADLLDLPGRNDLDRLVRHQAFWEAWLPMVRRGAVPPAGALGGLTDQVVHLAAGDVAHVTLPVHTVGGVGELYRVDEAALDRLVEHVLPGVPTSSERTRVQVLNGTGTPGAAADTVPLLVDAGARVAITGNADRFDYAKTSVVYYDDAHAADARRLRRSLGVGEVVRSRSRLTAVDVTVVVGADFAASSRGTPHTSEGATP